MKKSTGQRILVEADIELTNFAWETREVGVHKTQKAARKALVRVAKGWRVSGTFRTSGKPLESDFHIRGGSIHFTTGDPTNAKVRAYYITDRKVSLPHDQET